MLKSFREFKFYQSFRVPVHADDNVRFLLQKEEEIGQAENIEDAVLIDISSTGLAFRSKHSIPSGTELNISIQHKKLLLDLNGSIVRSFHDAENEKHLIYGVELDEDSSIYKFIHQYIHSFSNERLKDTIMGPVSKKGYTRVSEGFEIFSLLLSLFKDLNNFKDREGFIKNILEESVRVLEAQRGSVFLINPDTNQLESHCSLGMNSDELKFDYRAGVAGSVFTTGISVNIDMINDKSSFSESNESKKTNDQVKSIICYPIYNQEDKVVGVVEIANKRNQNRFSVEDERTMKVLSLVFSSVFHEYSPISETGRVRRFTKSYDRKFALIGRDPHVGSLRNSILKLKDLETPTLIRGERGVGKTLYAQILHHEGQRGLMNVELVDCLRVSNDDQHLNLFCPESSQLLKNRGGSIILKNIDKMTLVVQEKLFHVLENNKLEGSSEPLDIRVIATTCSDLDQASYEGTFHRDLYKYLSATYVYMNPLRRRIKDLTLLANYFLKIECQKQGLLLKSMSEKVLKKLSEYDWPGNIEELRRCIQRAVLYNPKNHIISDIEIGNSAVPLFNSNIKKRIFGDLPHVSNFKIPLKDRVAIVEREMIISEIRRNNGNKSKAAKEMGISREALRKKLITSDEVLMKHQPEEKVFSPDTLEKQQAQEQNQEQTQEDLVKKAA